MLYDAWPHSERRSCGRYFGAAAARGGEAEDALPGEDENQPDEGALLLPRDKGPGAVPGAVAAEGEGCTNP